VPDRTGRLWRAEMMNLVDTDEEADTDAA